MVEVNVQQRKTTANVLWARHRYISAAPPLFLRRNLRQILDSHGRRVRAKADGLPPEDMIANERRISGWDFPTREMLKDLMNGDKPVLGIDSLQIRLPRSKSSIKKRLAKRSNDAEDLDWLPNPDVDFKWPCKVGVTVFDTRTTATTKPKIHVESRLGAILQSQCGDHLLFDVELDYPFSIQLETLIVKTDSGTNGQRHWKRTVTAQYALEITVECLESTDSADFLSRLEGKTPGSYRDAPRNESILKATLNDLPKCPGEGQLLTLKRASGHKLLEMSYKVEVAMGWMRSRESQLERYNNMRRSQFGPRRQLPTPSVSDDLDKARRQYSIAWNFQISGIETRRMTVNGLFCPFCDSDKEHVSFDRLQLHCLTHHDYLSFQSTDAADESGSNRIDKSVTVTLASEYLDKPTKDPENGDEIYINWTAPNRPFDLAAYMRGADDWPSYNKQQAKASKSRGKAANRDRDVMPPAVPIPLRKRSAPDEVEDIPERRPKRHCVPDVPGVNFYRTTSKQLLYPGELVSESDEDVDEFWLAQNQSRSLDDLGITGAAKDFTQAFNEHLTREQSDSSVLLRDCLIRFMRRHSVELQDIEWQRLFRAKLNQFRNARLIDDDMVSYCVRRLQTAPETSTEGGAVVNGDVRKSIDSGLPNGTPIRSHEPQKAQPNGIAKSTIQPSVDSENDRLDGRVRKKWTDGKLASRVPLEDRTTLVNGVGNTKATANGQYKTASRRVCTCGLSAKDARGGIACADPKCVRRDYHLACVGLERRVHGWRCSDCST